MSKATFLEMIVFAGRSHEFEKMVIGLLGNPDTEPSPHISELVEDYAQDVMRIFLGGLDTIPFLIDTYQQAVLGIFEQPLPEGDKQAPQDQIKDFTQLTHDFIKDVRAAASARLPDDG